MIFGSIGELIDKIKDLVVEYFNGISGQVNETIDTIRKDIEGVSNKLDDVKSDITNNVNSELQGLKDGVGRIESGINNGVQGELGNVNSTLNNRFNTVDSSLSTLNENINKLIGEQSEELKRLGEEAAKVSLLSSEIKSKEETIGELRQKNAEMEKYLSSAEKEQERLQSELKESKETLESKQQEFTATETALQTWRNAVADYKPVRDAMNNCEIFRKMLEERGLVGDSDKVLFTFVQELGKTIDFLRDVHDTALNVKKSQGINPTLMSVEEIAVYEALNKCYRSIWNIDFDVFVTPVERKSVGEAIYKIPFDKDDAVVLKDPRNRSLRFIKGIYVPLLLNREGRMYKQAYVEATNL